MKWFINMKIGAKLICAFVMVAVLAGIVGVTGIFNLKSLVSDYSDLYEKHGVGLSDINDVAVNYQITRVNIRDIVLDKNPANRQRYVENIRKADSDLEKALAAFEKRAVTQGLKKKIEQLRNDIAKYNPIRERVISLALSGQDAEAMTHIYTGEGGKYAAAINDTIQQMIDDKVNYGKNESEQLTNHSNNIIWIMIIIVLVTLALALGLGIIVSRMISNPVGEMVKAARQIADGNLNIKVESTSKDEIGQLGEAFRKMAATLNEVMSTIKASSEQVASGSKQMADSSMALSQGATEQASSIEQLTASLEEISAQTQQNAASANQANEFAENAKVHASQGNQQMGEMLKAMEEINESSGNISKIIKVIDEIAFQTNILALNAAVEAARAGQHGKGFAVVAEEVRNLAARSANAAKETTVMIEGSIKKVEGGTKIANETATALTEIVDGVAKVAGIVNDIAAASSEQASGIAQINQGIMQVSQVVQTNSATAEESAAASEELAGQAQLLQEAVSRFNLRKENYAGSRLNEISPEVMRVLESMAEKNGKTNSDAKPIKIALSDSEFGKY